MPKDVATSVTTMLVNAPLPTLIEQLGVSVANAQYAMDLNGIRLAQEMGGTRVTIGETEHTLLGLGFTPTFYAFTEATVEAKLAFSMTQSTEFSAGVSLGVQVKVVTASVDASYSRKFSQSAEGSSSIAARLVSLPAPPMLESILRREYALANDVQSPARPEVDNNS